MRDKRKTLLKLGGRLRKNKLEVNVACTGSRKLVLGCEGIFLHYLTIHNEGRKKDTFETWWQTEKTETGSECSVYRK